MRSSGMSSTRSIFCADESARHRVWEGPALRRLRRGKAMTPPSAARTAALRALRIGQPAAARMQHGAQIFWGFVTPAVTPKPSRSFVFPLSF